MKTSNLDFASIDPYTGMTPDNKGKVSNLCGGIWQSADLTRDDIVDPMTGDAFLEIPDTIDMSDFYQGILSCPKYGKHNPLYKPQRYVYLGEVCARAAALLATQEVEAYFAKLIQRVMPKSYQQCLNEVIVTRRFLENFAGDGVRFLGRGFTNPGDHTGQESRGYRWPFGPVVVIAPFNFPFEIPVLQMMGALFMGNRPLVKVDSKVSCVVEQFIRMLIQSGLTPNEIDLVHCRGENMGKLLERAKNDIRLVQFTGSSTVGEAISKTMNGRVRLEDAGFDWKIIGPDYQSDWLDYVAWQSDQDAYNASGQKCSAQSILFVHENWVDHLLPKLSSLAQGRKLEDLTVGPILSWTDTKIDAHIKHVLAVPGAELLFGGRHLQKHSIPNCYGTLEPTAIRVPLESLSGEHSHTITSELFGPFQIIVSYSDKQIGTVLEVLEGISHHLTAAVVSDNSEFQRTILEASVNGTTYCGMRARTTGAPQNHWFGPCGDPRAAGIGTPEAIIQTWSGHREIITDQSAIPSGWKAPGYS
ncbi:MAG: aldehyde dehydrogenase family protein [Halioglobus sp.]